MNPKNDHDEFTEEELLENDRIANEEYNKFIETQDREDAEWAADEPGWFNFGFGFRF